MNQTELEDLFQQNLIFVRESKKEYILMSDEQLIYCFYSIKQEHCDKPTIFFIQGLGPGIYSWSDFWDELCKEYNLVVIDSREKPTVNLEKNKACSVRRISLDIVEVINYLQIKEENVILFGTSLGTFYVAHCVGQGWIHPRGCFIVGPSIDLTYPEIAFKLAFILPDFLFEKVGIFLARKYIKNKVLEDYQRKVYLERIMKINVKRWKKCSKIRKWNPSDDYKNINCPVFIFSTDADKYHTMEEAEKVNNHIKNCHLVNVPDYKYMRSKPRVREFIRMIDDLIKKI
ncbi:MAG: alpha/beta hydrolase [Asgard group archaeon]|nr:alpha/beta hydrolase [Asgard group archaeon]